MTLASLFTFTATVKPFSAGGGFGDTYGAEFTMPCFIDDGLQLTTTAGADTVVSRTVLYAPLRFADLVPVDSVVTVNGEVHRVTGKHRRSLGGYRAADHVEFELT